MKKYIVFKLLHSYCAVELLKIKEVIATTDITPIPLNPNHIKGLINLRGEVLSVVDLRLKMNMNVDQTQDLYTIIICEVSGKTVGAIVDSVSNVTSISPDDLKPLPEVFVEFENSFIEEVAHVDDKLVLLLNLEQILDSKIANKTHLKIA